MNQDAELLFQYLAEVLYNKKDAALALDRLSPDFRKLGEGILFLGECILETRRFASDLSRGELNTPVPSSDNELAAPLKSLNASLRHLTWQTQQVARGDYNQRVAFMGDFADSFNAMVEQLDRQRSILLAELESSNEAVKQEREQVRHLEGFAYQDKLTNTYNRNYGMLQLDRWLEQGREFCLCFIDLDNLKYVNDTYGHSEGDAYIVDIVGRLENLGQDSLLCRLGGDEFMVLIPERGQKDVEEDLERTRQILIGDSGLYPRSLSYGVVQVGKNSTQSASDLLGQADERMYLYKRKHKKGRLPAAPQPPSAAK